MPIEYFEMVTNAQTGAVTRRDWSQTEIDAYLVAQAKALVPKSITPRQVRLLLLQQGLLSSVEAMIAQQDQATKIAWEFASEFQKDDPLLTQLAANLGLSETQIDEFFIAAATL